MVLSKILAYTGLLTQSVNADTVTQLTDTDFSKFVKDNNNVLVKFYAPWCGHCKKLAPEFENAAKNITGAKLAEIDCDTHKETCKKYKVGGYPTLKYFDGGKPIDYKGGRTQKDLEHYVSAMTGPAFEKIDSYVDFEKIYNGAVAFVASVKEGSKESKQFQDAAKENRLMAKFFLIEDSSVTTPKVVVVRSKDDKAEVLFSNKLVNHMKTEKLPIYSEVASATMADFRSNMKDFVYFIGKKADIEKSRPDISKVAENHRGYNDEAQYNFLSVDVDNSEQSILGQLKKTISFDQFDLPVMIRKQGNLPGKFVLETDFSPSNVQKWIKSTEDGTLKKVFKSESIPETNDGDVTTLVGQNFNSIVTDDKDVVVMIHAPWCGHCKKMMPEFAAAAKKLKELAPDTIMGIYDGTANEIDNTSYSFSSFPTVYFKKAGSAKAVKFPFPNNERTEGRILEYLSKNVKGKFHYEMTDEL